MKQWTCKDHSSFVCQTADEFIAHLAEQHQAGGPETVANEATTMEPYDLHTLMITDTTKALLVQSDRVSALEFRVRELEKRLDAAGLEGGRS